MRRTILLLTIAMLMAVMMALMAGAALAEPENTPPNCERGQARATDIFNQPDTPGQFERHRLKGSDCAAGIPPGE